jgi:hypothetical protein
MLKGARASIPDKKTADTAYPFYKTSSFHFLLPPHIFIVPVFLHLTFTTIEEICENDLKFA